MVKSDPKFQSAGAQSDSCLSGTLFASKSDLEGLKAELVSKFTNLRKEVNVISHQQNSSCADTALSSQSSSAPETQNSSTPSPLHSQQSSTSASDITGSSVNYDIHEERCNPHPTDTQDQPQCKVIIAGNSTLHQMKAIKMKVNEMSTVKLTRKGANLAGTVSRTINYLSKHSNEDIDLVL